jgi:hypothetical protein
VTAVEEDSGWVPEVYEEVVYSFPVTDRTEVRARVFEWREELRYDVRIFPKGGTVPGGQPSAD